MNTCSLAAVMMFHVNSSWTHSVFWSVEGIRVFQACAGKRMLGAVALVTVGRALLFSSPLVRVCTFSAAHPTAPLAQVKSSSALCCTHTWYIG